MIYMSKKILGIDEAGKGAVVGSLFIGGALITEDKKAELRRLGVKDSKDIAPDKRDGMENGIKSIVDDFIVLEIPANKIDELREEMNLNQIEVVKMAEMINKLKPDVVIIDSPQASTEKFASYVRAKLDNKDIEIICENKADEKYPPVSAASVLAKVSRDRSIRNLEEELGVELRSGYPHENVVIKHLEEVWDREGKWPDYVRKSWNTAIKIVGKKEQKGLQDFLVKKLEKDKE